MKTEDHLGSETQTPQTVKQPLGTRDIARKIVRWMRENRHCSPTYQRERIEKMLNREFPDDIAFANLNTDLFAARCAILKEGLLVEKFRAVLEKVYEEHMHYGWGYDETHDAVIEALGGPQFIEAWNRRTFPSEYDMPVSDGGSSQGVSVSSEAESVSPALPAAQKEEGKADLGTKH